MGTAIHHRRSDAERSIEFYILVDAVDWQHFHIHATLEPTSKYPTRVQAKVACRSPSRTQLLEALQIQTVGERIETGRKS